MEDPTMVKMAYGNHWYQSNELCGTSGKHIMSILARENWNKLMAGNNHRRRKAVWLVAAWNWRPWNQAKIRHDIVPRVFWVAQKYSLRENGAKQNWIWRQYREVKWWYWEHRTRLMHSTSTATIELSYYIAYCRDIFIEHQRGRQRIGYSTKGSV